MNSISAVIVAGIITGGLLGFFYILNESAKTEEAASRQCGYVGGVLVRDAVRNKPVCVKELKGPQ